MPRSAGNGLRSALGGAIVAVVLAAVAAVAVLTISRHNAANQIALLDAADLPRLDAEIQRDVQLLKAQQAVVRRAEAKVASSAAGGHGAGRSVRIPSSRHQSSLAEGRVLAGGSARRQGLGSADEEHSYKWETRQVNRHLGDMERASRSGLAYEEGYQQKKEDEWGAFFDQLNTEVDVPKYGLKNILVDNIEAIPPCNADCDKEGTDNPEPFDWFTDLNRENHEGHIVDNLHAITACTIDC